MGRRNKMTGTSEQFQYILRDESMHVNFGIDVINQIKLENPAPMGRRDAGNLAREMILEGTNLEVAYARDTMPRGVLRNERQHDGRVPAVHRQPPPGPDRAGRAIPWRKEPVPLDVGNYGPQEGKEFFRNTRYGVSNRWCVNLGLTYPSKTAPIAVLSLPAEALFLHKNQGTPVSAFQSIDKRRLAYSLLCAE